MTLNKTDSLRRDLFHSNFERIREMTEDESDSTYILAPSPSAPTLTDKRKINENRNNNNNNNKKRNNNNHHFNNSHSNNNNNNHSKKNLHTNASPAEVFHRNLVDAVSNVDDSDENEHYVYPFSGAETDLNRPLSVRSSPLYDSTHNNTGNKKGWFQALTPSKTLKEYIKKDPLKMPYDERKSKRFYPPRRRYHHQVLDGYTSDDEEMPLLKKKQQLQNKKSRNKNTCRPLLLIYIPLCVMILIICLILYSATPLRQLEVELGRVLATDKELIFDLKVQAENTNAWTVQINECDLSVFAFSQIVPNSIAQNQSLLLENDNTVSKERVADPAEYLGGLHHFDEPLSIHSDLIPNSNKIVISQIRIKSPGADTSGNERWSRMIRYPYGLVVRGVMKYHIIPFIYPSQSLAVCHVARVDPTTGAVTINPDKSFCNEVQI